MADKVSQLEAVDAMLAELGLEVEVAPVSPTPTAMRGISSGPGALAAARSGISSGPGAFAAGRGISSGPGAMGRGMSSGPGAMGRGMSSGPGAMGPGVPGMSRGPGGLVPNGTGGPIVPATHTPDGRPVNFTGPPCGMCGEMVIGKVVTALDKSWHPEHWICNHCSKPFGSDSFIDHDGMPYCEKDFNELFGDKCATCFAPIVDKCITAGGKMYHPEHFYCAGCGTELRGKPYKEDEGECYCLQCKAARTVSIQPSAGICGKCKRPILGEYITLFGQRMHPEHFRCEECGCEFKGGNCHEYEEKLYCYQDYLKLLKSICGGCQKPIIGRSVTALGKVWHPEHFICYTCKESMAASTFHEHEGKAYCELHYLQQFGKICNRCNRPIKDNIISALGKYYHHDHFLCTGCEKPLSKNVFDMEGKPFCRNCYDKLPAEVRKRIEKKKEGEIKAQKAREKEAQKEAKKAQKEAMIMSSR